jgi:hypothetical protein
VQDSRDCGGDAVDAGPAARCGLMAVRASRSLGAQRGSVQVIDAPSGQLSGKDRMKWRHGAGSQEARSVMVLQRARRSASCLWSRLGDA